MKAKADEKVSYMEIKKREGNSEPRDGGERPGRGLFVRFTLQDTRLPKDADGLTFVSTERTGNGGHPCH
jgi:hypothetical protein